MAEGDKDWEIHLRTLSSSARESNFSTDPASDQSLLRSVRKLTALCKSESSENLVARVYPQLNKIYQRSVSSISHSRSSSGLLLLAILQFFLDYGEFLLHDADPSLRTFFRSCLSREFADPVVAEATLDFLNLNKKKILLSFPTLLPQFYPLMLKLIAWNGEKLEKAFLRVFPGLMSPGSFLPLFISLVDLPVLVVALEKVEKSSGPLIGSSIASIQKSAAPEMLLALMDEAYTGSTNGGADSESEDSNSITSDPLFLELLKDENDGLAQRHWTSPGMEVALQAAITLPSDRLKQALKLAPRLLDVYFSIALHDVNHSLKCALIPMLLDRNSKLFPDKIFTYEVRKRLLNFILAAFHQSPEFVAILKKPIVDRLGEAYDSPEKELAMEDNGKVKKDGMFRYAERYDKFLMFWGTLGSIGDGLQIPLMMYVLSDVINDYGNPNADVSNSTVDKYSLRLLYVAILVGVAAFVEGLCWARTAERQASRMRLEYLKSVLKQDVGFFDTQEAGSSTTYQVVSTISADSNSIQITIGEKIPNCLAYLSSFFFCHIFAFTLSWRLTLAALPFSVVFLVPALGFGKHMMDVAMAMVASYGTAGSIAEQAISSIRTVYSYVGESQTLDKFSKALETTTELGIKQGLARGLMLGSMGTIYVSWAFQAWVGSLLVMGHKPSYIVSKWFRASISRDFRIYRNILTTLPNLTAITESQGAATRINEMINRNPTIDSEDKKGKALSYVRGEIEFKGIYFSYPSRPDTTILEGLNLRVPAGKTVGLVGGSGSGKSTTIALIQRFYDPIEGEIFLDGYKIKKLHLKWFRAQMGLVNQEPILFATSIKENILFGKEGGSMDDVVAAAKGANAHDFIAKLPDGYETNVSQTHSNESCWAIRVSTIGRAKAANCNRSGPDTRPKILLLDEATSALDSQSERIVQEAIDQASVGRTTIVIAHRLSTIRRADLIYVLQSGKVLESGKHDELMQTNGGEYSKMVRLQQSDPQSEIPERSTNTPSRHRPMVAPSPASVRSSAPGTPSLNPFSPAFSMSAPYSVQFDASYESDDENYLNQPARRAPSQIRLLKMNAPEWGKALSGCMGAIGSGAVQPINAYCVGGLINVYFRPDKSTIVDHARIYSFVFLGLGVFNFFSSVIQHYNFAVMGEKLTTRVREKLLEKLLTFEIGWFDRDENTSAAICARLSTEANMVRSLVGDRLSLLTQAFFGAIFAYVLGLVLSWRLALVLMAAQPLLIGSFYARSALMKSLSEKTQKAQKEGSQLASEAVINHRTITAFSSQKRIIGLFKDTLEGPRKESIRQSYFSGIGLFSSQFLAAASTALAYWYGGRLLTQGLIAPEKLFQAFLVLLFTAYTIADAGSMTKDISRGSSAVGSVFAILDKNTEIDPNTSWGRDSIKGAAIRGRVELKNVFFAYPSRPDQMVFKGLNLKIRQGTSMALVGPSGSGKSTVIGLIERFYDPLKGAVFIDERDVKDYNLRALRSHIALVSQEPTLFAGTIHENIAYGKQGAKESEIRKAAMLANAHEFISGMKDGYDTYCGERGVQLSGGQKQRIALARAMLKNPSILLLDEATSALDTVSESLVQEALEKMMNGRTCIVVAHRLTTIQKSDSIAVIQDGKVAEQGTHSDLLTVRGGAYSNLVKIQGGK
ncbi:hypothetical protein OSB04_015465 [Centaurea solstitialis]|uniref:Uncharacterized protein n=1 Tax=Centaurea solstitialis TaxID=347529 RepID=A0AA38WGK8_9ASTR|nr:hypothetical protein OSB04_015465 [Centaurea solstitialis]